MIKLSVETPTATLRYTLAPDEAGIAAIEATFAAYDRMMEILGEVAPVGANLVSLHAQAYEKIRKETGLPAELARRAASTAHSPVCLPPKAAPKSGMTTRT